MAAEPKNKRLFVDWNHVAVLVLGAGAGIIAVLLYASSFDGQSPAGAERGRIIGSALIFALAAGLAGGLLGFLFGVPRALTADASPPGGTLPVLATGRYAGNTNLEQVSDWLTKILLGATLVQLGSIADGAGQLFSTMGDSLGGEPHSEPFAGGLVVYFSTLGFLLGWLGTRLYLATALNRTDLDIINMLKQAEAADQAGDPDRASRLRSEALARLTQVTQPLGEQFNEIRATPAGPARTRHQEATLASARQALESLSPSKNDLITLFRTDETFNRVLALSMMRSRPDDADVDCVVDGIMSSRTAFEHYHALRAAEAIASNNPQRGDRERLMEAVREALEGPRKSLLDDERRDVAQRLLRKLAP